MHRRVDQAFGQPDVEFAGPQRFAADVGQWAVLDLVAACLDRNPFDRFLVPPVRSAQSRPRFLCLRHRQRGSARAEPYHRCINHWVACPNGHSASGKPAMGEDTVVLGIESSCDETAAALVTGDRRILAQRIASQEAEHAPYGGVVPEIAARAHVERLAPLIERVLAEAKLSLADCDAIAATAGPGLIG